MMVYTHLGGSPASSACVDAEGRDLFTPHKDLVNCVGCQTVIRGVARSQARYVVDYNPAKRSWGVYDTQQGEFVSSTTTRSNAKLQRLRINRSSQAWTGRG